MQDSGVLASPAAPAASSSAEPGLVDKHGHPWIAFVTCVVAWLSVVASVYVKALWVPVLDVGTILAAAGILTGVAATYAAGAAWVKSKVVEQGGTV